ncbi:hypothetical protein LINPERHAP2_LOCUS41462, partial [Linum perenne]
RLSCTPFPQRTTPSFPILFTIPFSPTQVTFQPPAPSSLISQSRFPLFFNDSAFSSPLRLFPLRLLLSIKLSPHRFFIFPISILFSAFHYIAHKHSTSSSTLKSTMVRPSFNRRIHLLSDVVPSTIYKHCSSP